MLRLELTKLRVTIIVVFVAVVLASLYALFLYDTDEALQETEMIATTTSVPLIDEMSSIVYVSETPFPCGPDLKKLCTTLEIAPLLLFADSPIPSSAPELAWSDNENEVAGADGTAIGTGHQNTLAIIASHKDSSILSAAAYADAYVYDGKDDWYLPSKDELDELCKKFANDSQAPNPTNRCAGSNAPSGDFAPGMYWSSSESGPGFAWYQSFSDGSQYDYGKYLAGYVRVVRAF